MRGRRKAERAWRARPSHDNRGGCAGCPALCRLVPVRMCMCVWSAWLSTRNAVDTGRPEDLEEYVIKPEQGKECVT